MLWNGRVSVCPVNQQQQRGRGQQTLIDSCCCCRATCGPRTVNSRWTITKSNIGLLVKILEGHTSKGGTTFRNYKTLSALTTFTCDKLENATFQHTHTHTFNGPLSGTTRVSRYQKGKNQSGFYWSKRQWMAVASAGPHASLHLAPDR